MSNLTDFLDGIACVLNNPGKTLDGAYMAFKTEDGIDQVEGKGLNQMDGEDKSNMSEIEKKMKLREYNRLYMQKYLKTYVQPEHKKNHHNSKKRRKYGTALITSMKRRKEAAEKGLTIDKNGYIIREKEQKDETQN